MTNTVTLLADHIGNARPYVVGHQYVSIGDLAVSTYRAGSPVTASVNIDGATDETLTRDPTEAQDLGGSYLTDGFVVGDLATIVGSSTDNDAKLIQIKTLTAAVLTTEADTALGADTGAGEVLTHAGEKILASSFGLKSMTHLEILSQENMRERYVVTSPRESGTYCYLYAFNTSADNNSSLLGASLVGGANAAGNGALGSLQLKVTGQL